MEKCDLIEKTMGEKIDELKDEISEIKISFTKLEDKVNILTEQMKPVAEAFTGAVTLQKLVITLAKVIGAVSIIVAFLVAAKEWLKK